MTWPQYLVHSYVSIIATADWIGKERQGYRDDYVYVTTLLPQSNCHYAYIENALSEPCCSGSIVVEGVGSSGRG